MPRLRVESFTISVDGYGDGGASPALGYACTGQAASDKATHVVITKRV